MNALIFLHFRTNLRFRYVDRWHAEPAGQSQHKEAARHAQVRLRLRQPEEGLEVPGGNDDSTEYFVVHDQSSSRNVGKGKTGIYG